MDRDRLTLACTELVSILAEEYQGWEGAGQFKNTPERLVRSFEEFCWPSGVIETSLMRQFRVFENGYDEMLVTGPITVWTLCPHHLLPARLSCWIGYIPDGKVLGLSKFARAAEVLGKRPVMQEQYTTELAQAFTDNLKPKGVGVVVKGIHNCMTSRGVKQVATVTTSKLLGCFLEDSATRAEFYSVLSRNQ